MTKKKGLSAAERRRRQEAAEKAREFNVKTKGMRGRFKPDTAAKLKREDEGIPLKKQQVEPVFEIVYVTPDYFPHTRGMFCEYEHRQQRDFGHAGMTPVLSRR